MASPETPKMSDEILVEKVKHGDYLAFEELVVRYQNRVYRLAYRLTKNKMDAEDVLQDIFLQVYQKIKDFRGESAFSSWLYKISLNAAFMKLRKKRHRKEDPIEEAMPKFRPDGSYAGMVTNFSISPENEALKAEAKMLIQEAIDKLPEEYRAVLVLRDAEGFSAEEVSQMLDLSVPAIKSKLHRARLFLRQKLENYFKARKVSAG